MFIGLFQIMCTWLPLDISIQCLCGCRRVTDSSTKHVLFCSMYGTHLLKIGWLKNTKAEICLLIDNNIIQIPLNLGSSLEFHLLSVFIFYAKILVQIDTWMLIHLIPFFYVSKLDSFSCLFSRGRILALVCKISIHLQEIVLVLRISIWETSILNVRMSEKQAFWI
jgi:hypothetical protein